MKNKKIIRKFTVLLAALVIMCGFSVTAYAGGGDESDDTPTPVTEETPAPETEPEETTGGYEPQPPDCVKSHCPNLARCCPQPLEGEFYEKTA